ncbi:MAG: flavodoxin [Candidatus Thiodiazotropha taylori]|nr:flavodoxin [Candidatus Thiodiazotropha taylori]
MHKIGIFFGTESGTTRLIAKKIARNINARHEGQPAAKPININRVEMDQLLAYDKLILGTPTYGEGRLPGKAAGNEEISWQEFLPQLLSTDFTGKQIALYGLGDQESYPDRFVDGMMLLHQPLQQAGAELIGGCTVEGFEFNHSKSVVDGRFVGLVLDQHLQHLLTEQRIDSWLDEILPLMLA